ncbi:MAG: radical SAM protein [Candidatus Moranbacteria bacterium]|nr:radical SAM protein [Candidatus Moranbacteria bacterium]MDD3964819.1 radical SAM protein [Candidatus Moranbacteria bacterium]
MNTIDTSDNIKGNSEVNVSKFGVAPQLDGYYFSPERAREARDQGRLLSIRIEPSFRCNLRCEYCYNKNYQSLPDEISYSELEDIIYQAKELGAESIVNIGGGEPTIYPRFKDLTIFINSLGMVPVIFTNAQTMTKDLAKFLFDNNVSVIIKFDSLTESIQDSLSGVKGAHRNIMQGLDNLLKAGYAHTKSDQKLKLGASFVISKKNAHEVVGLWKFCRERKIFPNLEMMTPNETGTNAEKNLLSRQEWKEIKMQLLEIDRNDYGFDWLPFTPLVGSGCFQLMYSFYITARGFVRPCAAIEVEYANIKDYSLKNIMKLPFYQMARNIDKHLQGKCGGCKHILNCLGCRGMAFSIGVNNGKNPTTALCGEDPSCFK